MPIGITLWQKFSSPSVLTAWATCDALLDQGVTQHRRSSTARHGIEFMTRAKFSIFRKTLPPAEMVMADLLYGIMTGAYDKTFLTHVQEHPEGGAADHTSIMSLLTQEMSRFASWAPQNSLCHAFRKLGQAEHGAPAAPSQAMTASLPPRCATPQEHLLADMMAMMQQYVRFHAPPATLAGPSGQIGADMNKILRDCPFHQVSPDADKCRAWLLSADLYPGFFQGPKDYQMRISHFAEQEVPASMQVMWQWVLSVRRPNDVIIICDGRFPQVRRFFDNEMSKLQQSFCMEMWIIYETPTGAGDPRYPKRQRSFSNMNREVMLVYRPVPINQVQKQPRQGFNACGESSSFDLTYSGVQLRNLKDLPMLIPQAKRNMMGPTMDIPFSYPWQSDISDYGGVPFSWGETKPVMLWVAFFTDLGIGHVFDLTAGSAAAAIGAHYASIQYDGICWHMLHKTWCEQLMRQALLALTTLGRTGASPAYVKKVLHFFAPKVAEAMRMYHLGQTVGVGMGEPAPSDHVAADALD